MLNVQELLWHLSSVKQMWPVWLQPYFEKKHKPGQGWNVCRQSRRHQSPVEPFHTEPQRADRPPMGRTLPGFDNLFRSYIKLYKCTGCCIFEEKNWLLLWGFDVFDLNVITTPTPTAIIKAEQPFLSFSHFSKDQSSFFLRFRSSICQRNSNPPTDISTSFQLTA